MKVFFRLLKIALTMLVVVMFGYILYSFESNQDICDLDSVEIKKQNINPYEDFSEEKILEKIHSLCDTNQSKQDINTSLLEDLILEDKYIKKAEVYLNPSGQFEVFLDFKQPFVRMLKNQEMLYLDDELNMLPTMIKPDNQLIVLSGDIEESNNDLVSLIRTLYSNKMLNNLIGGINYNAHSGYVLSSRLCDLAIDIGFKKISQEIIQKIEIFFLFQSQYEDCSYCDTINLKYTNQVICLK